MIDIKDDLLACDRQLYPTGRAFAMPVGGILESLHIALNNIQNISYNDIISLLDGLIPDNDGFTEDDASNWERVYGLTKNSVLDLATRKKALLQVIAYPNGQPARSHYLFLQDQLQQAGFDVWIHENIFDDGMGGFVAKTPLEVYGISELTAVQYGDRQYGDTEYGQYYTNKIANYIDEKLDLPFDLGSSLSGTFFIGGETLGTFADVPLIRKNEFRQLILKTKPLNNVGFIFVNYI